MKEATRGAGSLANVVGKLVLVISPERDDKLSSDTRLTLWCCRTLRLQLPAGQAKPREWKGMPSSGKRMTYGQVGNTRRTGDKTKQASRGRWARQDTIVGSLGKKIRVPRQSRR